MSAVKLVSMAMSGNVKLLKEYGIELDENATASDNLVRLQQAVAGQYEASGQTIEAQSKIIKGYVGLVYPRSSIYKKSLYFTNSGLS